MEKGRYTRACFVGIPNAHFSDGQADKISDMLYSTHMPYQGTLKHYGGRALKSGEL